MKTTDIESRLEVLETQVMMIGEAIDQFRDKQRKFFLLVKSTLEGHENAIHTLNQRDTP